MIQVAQKRIVSKENMVETNWQTMKFDQTRGPPIFSPIHILVDWKTPWRHSSGTSRSLTGPPLAFANPNISPGGFIMMTGPSAAWLPVTTHSGGIKPVRDIYVRWKRYDWHWWNLLKHNFYNVFQKPRPMLSQTTVPAVNDHLVVLTKAFELHRRLPIFNTIGHYIRTLQMV